MPRFEPFSALRYAPDIDLDLATAPPYDVLSSADVDVLQHRHPTNITYLDVPRASAPSSESGHGQAVDSQLDTDPYLHVADLLQQWQDTGTLVSDLQPSYTLYRMQFVDELGVGRQTVGVLGALEVVDDGAPGVLPHERTTPKAKTDRLDLTRATNANLSPVWGLSLAAGLTALLRDHGDPVGTCTDDDGVIHSVERVSDPVRIDAIRSAVQAHTVLIADGHHRYAISRTYRDEQRQSHPDNAGAELTLTYVAELIEDQLTIDAIHRLYSGVPLSDLLDRLALSFEIQPAGMVDVSFAQQVVDRGSLCLVLDDGSGMWLTPRPEAFPGIRSLDGALLEHALADLDGLGVDYQHGVTQVVDRVRLQQAVAGVLIRPTSIDEIRRTANERLLMPPKSTFFTPKLRTGFVIRPM